MPHIISASRRTDIPQYYARWFAERRKEGLATFRNAFGGAGEASLRREDTLGYLFWTKYAPRFADNLAALRDDGIPYVFQYTVNGYGKTLEPQIPPLARVLADFRQISANLPGPEAIQWRYDPIIKTEELDWGFHERNFRHLASELKGATKVVNTSAVEPYLKAVRRIDDSSAVYRTADPKRHKTVIKKWPNLLAFGADFSKLVATLSAIAEENGMELRACANPEWGLAPAQCCGPELFAPYGHLLAKPVADLASGPSRQACRCIKVVDIGMDNTCLGGCKYCYVVTSHHTAVKNHAAHEPTNRSLR